MSCASCHLPRGRDGHRDHRFNVTRNLALLRDALQTSARRTPEGLEVSLRTRDVGHAMPTGDLFRRLRVVVVAEDREGQVLGDDEAVLGRRFDRRDGVPKPLADDRVFGQRTIQMVGAWLVTAHRITIDVRYERVAQTYDVKVHGGATARRDQLFASDSLAELTLEE